MGQGGRKTALRTNINTSRELPLKARHELVLALLATYLHRVAFPFYYGVGQNEFQLPMVAWLRDPSLFPGDPMRDGFASYPSVFWHVVAWLAGWFSTETILFVGLFASHFFVFWGVARIVVRRVGEWRFVAIMVIAVALAPLLVTPTPFGGGGGILGGLMTHTAFAGALSVWVAASLLEGRWIRAAVLLGFVIHIHLLLGVYLGFAFLVFLWPDWRERRSSIFAAGGILLLFGLAWLYVARRALGVEYPEGYVDALLIHYPYHLVLSTRPAYDLLRGLFALAGIGAVAGLVLWRGAPRERRLELLVASTFIPILLGIFVGEFFRVPQLLLLQLLRADTFLFFFGVMLAQIYGFRLLILLWNQAPAAGLLAGIPAILFPLGEGRALPAFVLVAALFAADRRNRFDALCRWLAGWRVLLGLACVAFVVAATGLLWQRGSLEPDKFVILLALVSGPFVYLCERRELAIRTRRIAVTGGLIVLVCSGVLLVEDSSMLWRPVRPLTPEQAAWREIQNWAREHTSKETRFMVPPFPGGFRVFSQRSCWVSWRDGDTFWMYPPYAPEWRRRIAALGLPQTVGRVDDEGIEAAYRHLPWERLLALARENDVQYVVQFSDVAYARRPVFSNDWFSIYRANE